MARREAVLTDKAPKPVGPYSQGIIAGGCFLFISGQIPIDPEAGKLVEGSFEEKARRVMDNIKAIVEAAGGSMDDIVKVTVYLTDISRFSEFNRIYSEYFKAAPPSRVVVGVKALPLNADLEVEAIAYLC
jgi:2-iminobutanoate/2-iminopropanoate deaminase